MADTFGDHTERRFRQAPGADHRGHRDRSVHRSLRRARPARPILPSRLRRPMPKDRSRSMAQEASAKDEPDRAQELRHPSRRGAARRPDRRRGLGACLEHASGAERRQRRTSPRSRAAWPSSKPAPPPAGDAEALGALDARVKTLEERKVETPADVSDLTSRVTRLEGVAQRARRDRQGWRLGRPTRPRSTPRSATSSRSCKARSTARSPPNRPRTRRACKDLQNEVAALKAKLGALAEAQSRRRLVRSRAATHHARPEDRQARRGHP